MPRLRTLALALLALPAAAQDAALVPTALPVLDVPAVATLGGASVGRLGADPRLVLQNPAGAALMARDVAQSAGGTVTAPWFGESQYGAAVALWGLRRGRLAAAVALGQGALRGSDRTLADGTPFEPVDRFRSVTAAVGTTGAVRVAAGLTGRYVTASDAPVWLGDRYRTGRLRGATLDAGLQATADVAALAGAPRLGALRPALDVTAGYAQASVSGEIRYSGFDALPLARTASLGWSARTGLDLPLAQGTLRLVEAEAAFSAERLLVERDGDRTRYAPLSGGLRLADAALGTGGDLTTGRRGVALTLGQTLTLSRGRFDGWGYDDVRTRGWSVSTAGLSAVAAPRLPGAAGRALARTQLRVGRQTVWAGTDRATSQTTLALVVTR